MGQVTRRLGLGRPAPIRYARLSHDGRRSIPATLSHTFKPPLGFAVGDPFSLGHTGHPLMNNYARRKDTGQERGLRFVPPSGGAEHGAVGRVAVGVQDPRPAAERLG